MDESSVFPFRYLFFFSFFLFIYLLNGNNVNPIASPRCKVQTVETTIYLLEISIKLS